MTTTAAPVRFSDSTAVAAPRAPSIRALTLAGQAGRLEAILNEGDPHAGFAALVCHPHPQGGGTMHNKVVYHAMKALNDPKWGLSLPTLRFNFRGVGLSQGSHDGHAEVEDVFTAMEWLENAFGLPLIVVGFSFGAAIALEACSARQHGPVRALGGLAALGLPLQSPNQVYSYPFLSHCTIPKLFLSGTQDEFAPIEELARMVDSAAEPKRLMTIPGADHFFTGHLETMQTLLTGWLQEHFHDPSWRTRF